MAINYTKLSTFKEFEGHKNPLDNDVFQRRSIVEPLNAELENEYTKNVKTNEAFSELERRVGQKLHQRMAKLEQRLEQLVKLSELENKRFKEVDSKLNSIRQVNYLRQANGLNSLMPSGAILKIVKNGDNFDVLLQPNEILKLALVGGACYLLIKELTKSNNI